MKYTPQEVVSQDDPVRVCIPRSPGHNYDQCLTIVAPEINPGAPRVYPAPKHRSWKVAPPYMKSFKKILQDREIKMTDYSVGTIDETWHLASVYRYATNVDWYEREPYCLNQQYYSGIRSPLTAVNVKFYDNYDIGRATEMFPTIEYFDHPTDDDIRKTLIDVKAKVVQDSYSGFDALTELAEFPETLGMLLSLFKAALRPIQGIKELQEKYRRARARGKTHEVAHGEIASQWMQYRYGIMPLVYSIQDAIKLLDEAFSEFKVDRTFSVLRSEPKFQHHPETHVAVYRSHELKISAVARARFATQSLRLKDLITTNLFVTAWELIPMSFVIDWFINVGDVIASSTSGFAELAEERKFCFSIRRTTIDKYFLRYNFIDGADYSWSKDHVTKCAGNDFTYTMSDSYNNQTYNIGSILLYERREESYDRKVFLPNSVELKFEPDLNWQRLLDGYVLSFNQVRKVLKSRR